MRLVPAASAAALVALVGLAWGFVVYLSGTANWQYTVHLAVGHFAREAGTAVFDVAAFPWVRDVEAHAAEILAEFNAYERRASIALAESGSYEQPLPPFKNGARSDGYEYAG